LAVKTNQKGLGKGLSALIPAYDTTTQPPEEETEGTSYSEIDLNAIIPNPNQPRKAFDAESLEELASSIREHGILQPILVSREGGIYTIIAGERRYRAALLADLKTIPAIVKDSTGLASAEMALIENIQREDLNPIEEATAFLELRDKYHISQERIAALTGRSRTSIANTLRLLQLPTSVQLMITGGELTAGHARAVLALENVDLREEFALYIIEKDLTVREAERDSKTFGQAKPKAVKAELPPQLKEYEEGLSSYYGTKVRITPKGKKGSGKIEIEYYGDDDLERILNQLRSYDDM